MTTLLLGMVLFLGLMAILALSIPIRGRRLKEPWDLSMQEAADAPARRQRPADMPAHAPAGSPLRTLTGVG